MDAAQSFVVDPVLWFIPAFVVAGLLLLHYGPALAFGIGR